VTELKAESTVALAKPTAPQRELGRVYIPNPGARNYALRGVLPRRTARAYQSKRWRMGTGLSFVSQGDTSHCVRYGNTHILMLQPIVRPDAFVLTADLYPWAQRNDPWPGEEPTYYGTSVDAGLQFNLKIAKVIESYHWAFSMDDLLLRLSLPAAQGGGPLVVGVDWYTSMDNLNGTGRWEPSGTLRGGHCLTVIGHHAPTAKRSGTIIWGNSHEGNFIGEMEYDAAEWLLFAQNGEAAAVTELPKARKAA
jgi:hypothetical protein